MPMAFDHGGELLMGLEPLSLEAYAPVLDEAQFILPCDDSSGCHAEISEGMQLDTKLIWWGAERNAGVPCGSS